MHEIDWNTFISAHGIKASGKIRDGLWLEVKCPFCDDHSIHGAINVKSNGYNCWRCGKHSMVEFVSAVAGIPADYDDVKRYLKPYYTDYVEYIKRPAPESQAKVILKNALKLPGTKDIGSGIKQYLSKRGFDPEYIINKYNVQDGGIVGEWAYRLMIPVYIDGILVAWQGRHIGDNKIRYKASSLAQAKNIKDLVYNLDNCNREKCIVVEGVMDCWKLGDDCTAIFGISVRDTQLQLLASKFKEVYFLFDPEKEAQQKAKDCARKLNNIGCKAYVLNMADTPSEDPGELTREEVMQIKKYVFGDDYEVDPVWVKEDI